MAGLHTGDDGLNMHESMFMGTCASAIIISTGFVGLRLYVRSSMVKSVGYDDWILVGANVLFVAHAALLLAYSANMKINGVDETLPTSFLIFVYSFVAIAVKAALAAFFLKVLPYGCWQRKLVYISIALYSMFMFAQSWVFLFQCGNPYNALEPNPVCLNQTALLRLTYAVIIINAAMDWVLTLMPLTVIWGSLMSTRTKASVCVLVLLGALGSIISILRIPFNYLNQIVDAPTLDRAQPLFLMTMWENGVGIVAISLAALRPLMSKLTGGKWDSNVVQTSDRPLATITKTTTATVEKDAVVMHAYEVV